MAAVLKAAFVMLIPLGWQSLPKVQIFDSNKLSHLECTLAPPISQLRPMLRPFAEVRTFGEKATMPCLFKTIIRGAALRRGGAGRLSDY